MPGRYGSAALPLVVPANAGTHSRWTLDVAGPIQFAADVGMGPRVRGDGNCEDYSAAMRLMDCCSMSARQRARLSPSGSRNAAVRALATASVASDNGRW